MTRHSFRQRPAPADSANGLIFGRNPVLEMMRGSPAGIERMFVADGSQGMGSLVAEARGLGIAIETIARSMLDAMVGTGNHQGVAVRTKPFAFMPFEDLICEKPTLLVLLDGVLDPQNLGAIIRSAEVLGAGGVVIPKDRSATVTPASMRASSGATAHLPIAQVVNLVRSIDELKANGYWVVGLDSAGSSRFQDLPALDRVALIVGGEGLGMRPLVTRACDFVVGIPVRGRVGSLNAAAAAAIALHELSNRLSAAGAGGPIR